MNIILTGYRGTGKTSVGRAVAERLQMPFRDTDRMIQERTGRTVRDIVHEKGWPFFREEEKAVIRALANLDGSVVSLGGGAVMDQDNVDILKRNGLFVWLIADQETIFGRLSSDDLSAAQRPVLYGKSLREEIDETLRQRLPVYRSIADMTIDTTGRDIQEVAEALCDMIKESREKARGLPCQEIP